MDDGTYLVSREIRAMETSRRDMMASRVSVCSRDNVDALAIEV